MSDVTSEQLALIQANITYVDRLKQAHLNVHGIVLRDEHTELIDALFALLASWLKRGAEIERLKSLVDAHAAEINRRRGEMAVARELLDELGAPKERDGITLTTSQRIRMAVEKDATQ